MKRKWISAALALCIMVAGFTAKIYGVSKGLTQEELNNPNVEPHKSSITQKVLDSTGRNGDFSHTDAETVTVYYGDVLLDGAKEAIVSVKFGPKNTIVAAYTPQGEIYEYVSDVGSFFDVSDIQFIPVKDLGRNVLILTERANQKIGAFEESSFYRGYAWDEENEVFYNILSVPQNIKSSWNELWDSQGEILWKRVTQESEPNWDSGNNPVLHLKENQAYSESEDTDAKNIPEDESFIVKNNKVVEKNYYWNNEWGMFIIKEMIDKRTGDRVAVVEDFTNSAYNLDGEPINKYRIVKKDGTVEIVDADTLKEIGGAPAKNVFHVL